MMLFHVASVFSPCPSNTSSKALFLTKCAPARVLCVYAFDLIGSIDAEQPHIIDELASSAPIDHDKVSSIKKAISSGNYPLDLDKISDALMDAYNDMKS